MPASASACCSVSAPATVTGAIAPDSVNGVMTETCPARAKSMMPCAHRDIELARRIGVDHGVAVDAVPETPFGQPARKPDHLEPVAHLRRAAREDEERLVGERQLRSGDGVVAQAVSTSCGSTLGACMWSASKPCIVER